MANEGGRMDVRILHGQNTLQNTFRKRLDVPALHFQELSRHENLAKLTDVQKHNPPSIFSSAQRTREIENHHKPWSSQIHSEAKPDFTSLADIYEASLKNVLNITPNFLLEEKAPKQNHSEYNRERTLAKSPHRSRSPQQIPRLSHQIPKLSPQQVPRSPQQVSRSPQQIPRSPQQIPRSPQQIPRSPQQVPQSPQQVPRSPPALRSHLTSRTPPVSHPITVSRPSPTTRSEITSHSSMDERGRRFASPDNHRMERRPSPPRTLGRNGEGSAFRVPEKRRLSGENHFVKHPDFRLFPERISPVGIPPHFSPRFYPAEFHPHFPGRLSPSERMPGRPAGFLAHSPGRLSPPVYLNGIGNGRIPGRPVFLPHFPDIPVSPNHDRFSIWLAQQKEMAAIFHNRIHSDVFNKETFHFGHNLPPKSEPLSPAMIHRPKNGFKHLEKEDIEKKNGVEGLMKLAMKFEEKNIPRKEEKVEITNSEEIKKIKEEIIVKEEPKSPVQETLSNKENMADKGGRDSPRFKPYSLRARKSSASPPKDPFEVPLGIQTRNRAAIRRSGYKKDVSTINGDEDQEQFLSQLGLAKIIRQFNQH